MPMINAQDISRPEITTESIQHAAEFIQKARPQYAPIIDFYARVFMAQEESRKDLNISPITIEQDLLRLKFENAMPLIDPAQFIIDQDQAEKLLKKIIGLALDLAPKLAECAQKLSNYLETNGEALDLKPLFSDILENRSEALVPAAEKIDIPLQELMFFLFLSMAPSLQTCAMQLASYLKDVEDLKKGYCPVCGSRPNAGYLDKEGRRYLLCSMCAHEWPTRRMGCVSCETNDSRLLQYFYNEKEKEYRVYLCDNCHNYLKVVDLRHLNRAFIPRLEQIATLHLDMKAGQRGYKNPVPGPDGL